MSQAGVGVRSAAVLLALVVFIGLLGVVVTSTSTVPDWDANTVRWFAEHRSGAVVDVARAVTLGGHFGFAIGASLAIGAGLAWQRVPGAWLPTIALTVVGVVGPLVKDLFDRPRPAREFWAVIEHGSGYPSGHSAQSAAAWITLTLVVGARWPQHARGALAVAVVVVGAVGLSRVTLGVHSPTDVLGGWALGTLVALATVHVARVVLPRPPASAGPENEKGPA